MHAYLIMAHNQFNLLGKLVSVLDDERNDIYIHVDKRAKDFDSDYIAKKAKRSNLYFIKRRKVVWGDYSQVETELDLLEAAAQKQYDYLHLLSGVDMPIKDQNEIHSFFDKNNGKELVFFTNSKITEKEAERVRYYHFFTGKRNIFNRFMTKGETVMQSFLGADRIKGKLMQRGSQWFSITGDFAKYLAGKRAQIKKQFKYTFIPDEFFVQTAVINSPFKDNLYCTRFDDSNEQNMRYIDWERGHPYTFDESDFDEIMDSNCLFVRKLTQKNSLPDMILEAVMNKNQ